MRERRKKSIWQNRAVWVLGIVIVLIAGFVIQHRRNADESSQTTYEFGEVEVGDVRSSVTATGTIQPWKTVDVKSNVAGRVDKLAVDLGDRVKAGQLIALIDPTDSVAAVTQARSDVMSSRASAAQAAAASSAQPTLTRLSIQEAQASLDSARQSVAQAQEQKKQLQQDLATQQEVTNPQNLENAQSDLHEAQANLDAATAEYARQQKLLAKGYTSQSEVDSARATLATRQASANTARQREKTVSRQNQLAVQSLQARIKQADASIQDSKARVAQATAALALARRNSFQDFVKSQQAQAAKAQVMRSEAQLEQASTNLGYTRILAPRDGVVIQKNVEEGTVVPSSRASIGSTNALLQIGDTSRLWIVCQVDETDIGQVSQGQRVSIKIDAYPSMLVDGRVIRIDPQAVLQQNVTTVPVTVEIQDPDPRFKPGMTADCEFIVDEALGVLTVPNEALHEENGIYTVQKMVNGKPKDFEVEVGVPGPETTEIKSGLKAGDSVITRTIEPEASQVNNPLAFGPPGRRGSSSGSGARQGGGARGGGGR
ncbi:MAG: efflux RND transporter periplasmic adaptor subunit [Armatimonadetes bacterium]|nr:efflux RND transporter periplasmic adaptor subunit [Armatimonadota bacterium]